MNGAIYTQKTREEAFAAFKNQFPAWENDFGIKDPDNDSTYKRIPIVWKENSNVTHTYKALINVKTGDIYTDCSRRLIWIKQGCAGLIGRPIHTILKTAWHASLILPAIWEINKVRKKKQSALQGLKNFGYSTLDIIRTPIYGIAMTIAHIIAFIIGPFRPSTIHKGRVFIGSLERSLYRIDRLKHFEGYRFLTPCFSPYQNIAKYYEQPVGSDLKNIRVSKNTNNDLLSDFGKKIVTAMREKRHLFPRCFLLFPRKDIAYKTTRTLFYTT